MSAFAALSPIQQRAVELLVGGKSIASVARMLNVDRATVYRWKRIPEFECAIANASKEVFDAVNHRLLRLAMKAMATLDRVLTEADTKEAVRAAIAILRALGPFAQPAGMSSSALEILRLSNKSDLHE
jgi:transposase